jgi:hypothetical protein
VGATAAHGVAHSEAQAAEQHQAKEKAQQHHRAQRQLGVGPVLDRRKLFSIWNFVHSRPPGF